MEYVLSSKHTKFTSSTAPASTWAFTVSTAMRPLGNFRIAHDRLRMPSVYWWTSNHLQ
jgi:hypothetical protein